MFPLQLLCHTDRAGRFRAKLGRTLRTPGGPTGALWALLAVTFFLPLEGSAQAPAEEAPSKTLAADSFLVWIYRRAERDPAPIGYLRAGQSVEMRDTKGHPAGTRVKGGCGRGWFAVEPAGYVCADDRVTFKESRYADSMKTLGPDEGAYPFEYALSMGTPSYRRVPTVNEWTRKERIFGDAKPRPLPPHWQGHEALVGGRVLETSPMPHFLEGTGSASDADEKRLVRREVPFGSMLSVKSSFQHEGRSFLMSADGTVVPADRMRVFERSTFEGVPLSDAGLQLPLGWPKKATHTFSLSDDPGCVILEKGSISQKSGGNLSRHAARVPLTCLSKNEDSHAPRKVLPLSGRVLESAGTRFVELAIPGAASETRSSKSRSSATRGAVWVPESYLFVAEQAEVPGRDVEADGSKKKWIHFKISQGTLVSYVGEEAVFATLASPGIGGVPARGADPLETRTTPVGTYRINFKHRTDDMSPEQTEHRKFWIADVPHAMYFSQPFAIHVAYWHESFGEPMSGGCINVSPKDGERLFAFTDPPLPRGWYGVGASPELGYGTTIKIER